MNAKKIFGIVKTVLVWVVVAIAVAMMIFTLISVNTFDRNDRSLFGFKFFIVQTDSMKATDFAAGDVVISKEVDVTTLKEGDIITFISQSSQNYGETVTHKIREVTRDADGSIAFVTYGTTTDTNDEALATVIVGKYIGHIPKLGAFFLFLQTTPGYIVCILVPFLLLILSQGINCIRLFRKYRQEQLEAMQAEREKLEQEREESQKMMLELMALKAKLAGDGAQTAEAEQSEAPAVMETPAEPTVTEAAPAPEAETPVAEIPAEEKPAESAATTAEQLANEQIEAMKAEREKLEQEMRELMALKAQLAAQAAATTAEAAPAEAEEAKEEPKTEA